MFALNRKLTLTMLAAVLFPFVLQAEELRIGFAGSYEDKILDLPKNTNGLLEVSLQSSGRPLADYLIGLIRHRDSRIMMSISSDEHGIVRFVNVPPDRYVVKILRIPEEGVEDYVEIGDVLLEVYAKQPKKAEKQEDETPEAE